jgi:C_GCAxxG_C_C family probable redox protein
VPVSEDEIARKVIELSREGYYCGQILVAIGLDRQEKTNWDLIRAVEGLKGGLGFSGKICGTLTGAVCLLGLYAGRGQVQENPDPRLDFMVQELVDWFQEEIGKEYSGIDCEQIIEKYLDQDFSLICYPIITMTYLRVANILQTHGFDLEKGRTGPYVITTIKAMEKNQS